MERKYFLSEKSGNSFEIQPTCYTLSENNIIAQYYFIQKKEWVLFEIEHNDIQTRIDLSNVPDCVLVFLESNGHNWNVVGATHCLNQNEGAFGILTPHKKILCIPQEALININNLEFVSYVQTQSLPTWSSELAKIEEHVFVFFRLGIKNLVIKQESIREHNLQLLLKEYYEFADFDNDIFLLINKNHTTFDLLEIIKNILIPNGLKVNEDYCFIDGYVFPSSSNYDQHPDCISIPWLSGYFHPTTDKFGGGDYIHFAKNNLIKRIVFMFYQYLKNNHCHTLKNGVKVFLIKDGYLYFGYEQFHNPDLKISLLNILNNNYSEFTKNQGFDYMYIDSLEKWKAYCSNLNDIELITFYNLEIHKMKVRENGRYLFINALKDEIKSRNFDSTILDEITESGIFDSKFYLKLKLNYKNVLEVIENKSDIELSNDTMGDFVKWSKEKRENYLKSIEKPPKDNPLQYQAFLNGYGKFPYIILKTGYAIFMQIPIHFNTKGDFVNFPGTNLNDISDELLEDYKNDKKSELHDRLIEHCKWVKSKMETEKNREARICLVEGPEIGYYFDGDEVTFTKSIPSGGTLVTQQNNIIAMNAQHYL